MASYNLVCNQISKSSFRLLTGKYMYLFCLKRIIIYKINKSFIALPLVGVFEENFLMTMLKTFVKPFYVNSYLTFNIFILDKMP